MRDRPVQRLLLGLLLGQESGHGLGRLLLGIENGLRHLGLGWLRHYLVEDAETRQGRERLRVPLRHLVLNLLAKHLVIEAGVEVG